jgi:dihydrofolate reductase
MDFIAILCLNYNNTIGYKETNDLIFDIKDELINFKNITLETEKEKTNVLIMGRKTWESIKYKPLKNRMNFIISSNYGDINYEYRESKNVISFPNNEICLSFIYDNKNVYDKIFIIGGISIYEYYLNNNIINKIICTKITTPNNYGNILFNVNYLNFFKINKLVQYCNIDAINKINNEKIKLDYITLSYNKFSKIDINLIYNINILTKYFNDDDDIDSNSDTNISICEDDNFNNTMSISEIKNININDDLLFYISSDESINDNDNNNNDNNNDNNNNNDNTNNDNSIISNDIDRNNIELKHIDSWTIINNDFEYINSKYREKIENDTIGNIIGNTIGNIVSNVINKKCKVSSLDNNSDDDTESDMDKTYYF